MPDFRNQNSKLGGHDTKPTTRDVLLWHIFSRGPERYLGHVTCNGHEVFRWMDKLGNSADTLTAVPDEMFDTHPRWVEEYRVMMEDAVVIPSKFVEAVTAEQSFRKWVKTIT